MKGLQTYIIFIGLILCFNNILAQDTDAPDIPMIDSLTVQWVSPTNPNGDILITWQLCDSTDIRSYYILYLDEVLGTYQLLDSVDAYTHTYLDTKPNTNPNQPQTYVVQAVDSANNTSAHSTFHRTACLQVSPKEEDCKTQAYLKWQNYEGWQEGIEKVEVYLWANNQSVKLATVSPEQDEFVYNLPDNILTYDFFVRCISKHQKTSTSKKVTFIPEVEGKPSYFKPIYSEISNAQVGLKFQMDNNAMIRNYELARSSNYYGNYQPLQSFYNHNETYLEVKDVPLDTLGHPLYYKLFLLNDCHERIDSSDAISTLQIEGFAENEEIANHLNWNSIQNGNGNPKYYNLYAYRENSATQAQLIASQLAVPTYTHYLLSSTETQTGLCYYLTYHDEEKGCDCRSNKICLWHPHRFFMPNAFTPQGSEKNKIFKPTFAFIQSESYYFVIYDRFGFKVFETKDINEGWDGRDASGKKLYPPGVYTFYVKYYSLEGEMFERKGIFSLIN